MTNESNTITTETATEKTERENRETCRRIAELIEAIADGRVYKCPECGEIITLDASGADELAKVLMLDGCPNCGASGDTLEQYTLYDYFEDTYDVEYHIGAGRSYRSVDVMVACGGPNIYISTRSRAVELYWWSDYASYPLLSDAVEAIDDVFEELFNL